MTAAVAPPPRRNRSWIHRVGALLLPFALVGALEAGLRLFGAGHPTAFSIEQEVAGVRCRVPNPTFTWRFFPRSIARVPLATDVPVDKAAGTRRIFVLGGSAAMGDIRPLFGMARCLEMHLNVRYPGVRFEVVNAAMTAINSHVVREIAFDVLEQDPDLLVVYMGNNEVVGPFGAGNPLVPFSPSLSTIRARLAFGRARTWQLAERVIGAVRGDAREAPWRGMEEFLDAQVRSDDPALASVYEHFRANLTDVLDAARARRVPVVLATVAVNLADCPPFASAHRADRAAEVDAVKLAADEAFADGAFDHAASLLGGAIELDDGAADAWFRYARARRAGGDVDAARTAFETARDLDTLRFRADSRVNAILREEGARAGVTLVDVEAAVAADAKDGIPGREQFHEHVHFTHGGNHLVGRLLADGVGRALADLPPALDAALDAATVATRIGLTTYERLRYARDMRRRLERPPFSHQLGNDARLAEWDAEIARLERALADEPPAAGRAAYAAALASTDLPWVVRALRQRYGEYLRDVQHDADGAIEQFASILVRYPDSRAARRALGLLLIQRGRTAEAVPLLDGLLAEDDRDAEIHYVLGLVRQRAGDRERSRAHFDRAHELDPRAGEKDAGRRPREEPRDE